MNLKLNELSWILQENLIDKTANNEYFRSLENQPIFRKKSSLTSLRKDRFKFV